MANKSKTLELKTRVGVDGEPTYKASLDRIASSLKTLDKEMKASQSAFGDNANSMEALADKQRALQEQQEKHAEKVKLLKEMLEMAKAEFGENSDEVDYYRQRVADAETALNKCTNELNKTSSQIDAMGESAEDAGDDAEELGGDLNDLGDDAQDAGEDTESFGEKLKNVASIIGQGLAAAAQEVAAAFLAVGSAAAEAISGGFELAKSAGTFADDLLTLSTQTGISAEKLQEWSYASRFIDTPVETITGSMRKMIMAMGDAAGGSEQAQAKFDALGVSITNADGSMRSADEVFMDAIDALGQIQNPTERDAAAMELFGKSAQDLNPLIEAGSAAFAAMGQEAHDMGVVFNDEALSAMGAFDDSMQKLNATTDAVTTAIGASLIPAFQPLVDTASEAMAGVANALQDGFQPEDITAVGETIAGALKTGISQITTLLQEIGPELGTALGNLVGTAVEQLPDLVSALLPMAGQILSGLTDAVTQNAEQLGALAGDIVAKLAGFLSEHAADLVNAAGDVLGGLIDGLTSEGNLAGLVTSAVEMIGRLATALVENAGQLLAKGPEIMAQLIQGLKDVDWAQLGLDLIQGLVNGLSSAVNSLLETIKGIFTGIWDAVKGVLGIHSPSTLAAEAGKLILDGLVKGFEDAVGAVCDAVKRIFGRIWDAIKSIFGFGGQSEESKDAEKAGKDIMSGIKEGVTGSENEAKDAVKNAAKAVLDAMKTELGVAGGNSTKTKSMGEAVARGVADGLSAAQNSTFQAGATAVVNAVSGALNSAFGVSGTGFAGLGGASAKKYQDLGAAVVKAIADGIEAASANTKAITDALVAVADAAYTAAVGQMEKGINGGADSVNAAVKAAAESALKAAQDILTEDAGDEIGDAFTGGIEGGVEDRQLALTNQVNATSEAAIRAMEQIVNELAGRTAGEALGDGLKNGMNNRQGAVRSEAASLGNAAKQALQNVVGAGGSNFTSIGVAISEGVARGISSSAGRVAQAARSAAQAAYRAAQQALGINSPSTVMKQIGEYYDEGFAEGIKSGMRGVMDSATELSRVAAGSIQTTRSQAERIDYDRLGQATARALKAAGIDRPMLSIGKRVFADEIEPDVSRATRARSGQSVAGRSARMVVTT